MFYAVAGTVLLKHASQNNVVFCVWKELALVFQNQIAYNKYTVIICKTEYAKCRKNKAGFYRCLCRYCRIILLVSAERVCERGVSVFRKYANGRRGTGGYAANGM